MSTATNERRIPDLTLGWRMKMSLGHGSVGVQEMADHLGKSRATLTRWMGDEGARPSRAYLLQWAVRCGVDADWLEHGDGSPTGSPGTTNTERYSRLTLMAA